MGQEFFFRKKFLDYFNEHSLERMFFVYAPTGFGKTFAIESYLKFIGEQYVYVKLSSKLTEDEIEIMIKNAVQTPNKSNIVIDNFHFARKRNHILLLDLFVKSRKKFYILSQKELPIKYISVYLRSQIGLIGQELLAFDISEIKDIFAKTKLLISNEVAKKIYDNTKGFAIALGAAHKYMLLHNCVYDENVKEVIDNTIYTFFNEEVLGKYDMETRKILFKLSFLEKNPLELARRILGVTSIENLVENIIEVNFACIDDRLEYYFKETFRKFLYMQAQMNLSAKEFSETWQIIGDYYLEKNESDSACDAYLKAHRYDMAVSLIEKDVDFHAGKLIYFKLDEHISQIPSEILKDSIKIRALRMYIKLINNQMEEYEEIRHGLEEEKKQYSINSNEYRDISFYILLMNLLSPFYDTKGEGLKKYVEIREFWDKQIESFSFTFNQPLILSDRYTYLRWKDMSQDDITLIRRIMNKEIGLGARGIPQLWGAEVSYFQGNLDNALPQAIEAINIIEDKGTVDNLLVGYYIFVKIMSARGEGDYYHKSLDEIEEIVLSTRSLHLLGTFRACKVEFYLRDGDQNAAMEWYDKYAPTINNEIRIFNVWEYYVKGRVDYARKNYYDAYSTFDRIEILLKKYYREFFLVLTRIMKFLCLFKIGNKREAFKIFERIVTFSSDFNIVMAFAEQGNEMVDFLDEYNKIENKLEQKILLFIKSVYEKAKKYGKKYPMLYTNGLYVQLTKTELQVLKYIADGCSNTDIGTTMNITLSTVKTHVSRILTKLGCKNRSGVVAKAQILKIL